MKIKLLSVVLLSLFIGIVMGQEKSDVREIALLHLNNTALITGETMYFSANVISAKTGKYSNLSTILYVELVAENGKVVYQAKIPLLEGKGQGDFFIPSLITTGTYQLIAYTKWMKNFNDFFNYPIQIINPFEEYKIPENGTELEVSFYPEGGLILNGIENLLAVEVRKRDGSEVEYKGRVVDGNGEAIVDFLPSDNGVGRFTYTPTEGNHYQLIIETGGGFEFFDLPKSVYQGNILKVREKGPVFMVKFINQAEGNKPLKFQIHQNRRLVLEQEILSNSDFAISKSRLSPGVNRFLVYEDDQVIADRLIYSPPVKVQDPEMKTDRYDRRSLIKYPILLSENSLLSVSVRKIYENEPPGMISMASNVLLSGIINTHDYRTEYLGGGYDEIMDNLMLMSEYKWNGLFETSTVKFLPDHRGEIISGHVQVSDSTKGVDQQYVSFSIIGKDYQTRISEVSENGNFAILISPFEGERIAYLTNLNGDNAELIEVDNPFMDQYPLFEYPKIKLDSIGLKELVSRSIRNQIENAYFEFKSDSTYSLLPYTEEFGSFDYFYILDEFNRFPTIRDSFVEYIPTVAARERKSGTSFKVVGTKFILPVPDLKPLAFLDGLPVRADEILSFSPYRIESIGIINNRYFFGPIVADGIISFRTKNGDMQGFSPGDYARRVDYLGVTPWKTYDFPEYEVAELNDRMPDFRDQLYWNPKVEITANESFDLEFYTSDTQGKFEISVEGFTDGGNPVSIRKYFTVE